MKHLIPTLLASLAFAGPAWAQINPDLNPMAKHALHYGQRCIVKRGALLAVNVESLAEFYRLAHSQNRRAIGKMIGNHRIDSMIVDAVAVAVARKDEFANAIEIHIPGYLANVVTTRDALDGDVKGFLASH